MLNSKSEYTFIWYYCPYLHVENKKTTAFFISLSLLFTLIPNDNILHYGCGRVVFDYHTN